MDDDKVIAVVFDLVDMLVPAECSIYLGLAWLHRLLER